MAYYPKSSSSQTLLKDIQYKIRQLTLHQKLVGLGSILSIMGVFLPWMSYENKSFSGVQDMTYLIGYIILVLSCILFVFFLLRVSGKRLPRLPFKEHTFSMVCGLQIIILSVVAFSIYNKLFLFTATSEIQFGISITIIGGVFIILGSYFSWLQERKENVRKTFIHMPEEDNRNELEKIFQKTREDNKAFVPEETTLEEEKTEEAPPENREEQEKNMIEETEETEQPLPPSNLKMFE